MIKKFLLVVTIFSLFLLMFGCGPKKSMIKGGDTYAGMEGFIDDDTLQVKSLGFPKEGIDKKLQRRYTAKRAAQLNAEARIVEKLIGANITGKTATEDGDLLGEVIKKDFDGLIKGGVIVQETYADDDSCEIIYKVVEKGLKKKAEGGMGKVK